MTTTTNYSFDIPTVGADNSAWGADLNACWVRLDSILHGGIASIQPNLTFEAWEIGGVAVTASAAELNKLDGVTATTAELNKLAGTSGTLLTSASGAVLSGTSTTLTVGYDVTPDNGGTKSSGSFQPDPADGNMQYAVNGGAHTLSPPASDCSIVLHYTNNGSAGAISTAGFDVVTGDSFTTTDTHEFICYITRVNSKAHLNVVALQ